jgi:CRISPR-associated protein Cas2
MMVLIMERVPTGLRGELSRWMTEPKAGVFVGKVSAMVRDKLWELVCSKAKDGAATLIFPAPTEQGFAIRTCGQTRREMVDYEGLLLARLPKATEKEVNSEVNAS